MFLACGRCTQRREDDAAPTTWRQCLKLTQRDNKEAARVSKCKRSSRLRLRCMHIYVCKFCVIINIYICKYCMCVCMHICMYTCTCTYMHMCMYTCECVCNCEICIVCVCICIRPINRRASQMHELNRVRMHPALICTRERSC